MCSTSDIIHRSQASSTAFSGAEPVTADDAIKHDPLPSPVRSRSPWTTRSSMIRCFFQRSELVVADAADVLTHVLLSQLRVAGGDGLDDFFVLVHRRVDPARDLRGELADAGQVSPQILDQGLDPLIADLVEEDRVELRYQRGELAPVLAALQAAALPGDAVEMGTVRFGHRFGRRPYRGIFQQLTQLI